MHFFQPKTCKKPITVTEVEELSDKNDSETDCMIVEQVIVTDEGTNTTNSSLAKPNYNLRKIESSSNVEISTDDEDDQKNRSIIRKRNLKRGRLPITKTQNCIGKKVNIESLLKRRNACIQVHPTTKDISIQTNICDELEGKLPFKNRILNNTINVLQKRVLKLEQKLRTQSGALWMKKKKLTLLKEQNKELCQKLSDQSTSAIECALKEVLHEYFKDSTSPEDAVNQSKQLCLHANITFKK